MGSNKKPVDFAFDQEFKEQIDFLQAKVNIPTKKYSDMLGGAHSKAFVIAGATKEGILCDFHSELIKAQKSGTGLKEFKDSFNDIVKKHGWSHKGSAGWRAKVIFETNMRTSYQTGRYKQMTSPDVLLMRPFWEYRHGASRVPRQEHLHWDGLILPADSGWWSTHYPPNGWGCSCYVVSRSARDLKRLGKEVGKAPKINLQEKIIGHGDEARIIKVPKGIDPGWDYNPGEAAHGNINREKPLRKGGSNWIADKPKENHAALDMPYKPFIKKGKLKTLPKATNVKEAAKIINDGYGKDAVFTLHTKEFNYSVSLDSEYLAKHIVEDKKDPSRIDYIPLLKESIEDPQEVWMRFEKNSVSGKYRLVFNFFKNYEFKKDGKSDQKTLLTVANAVNGKVSITTMFPTNNKTYVNGSRSGKLVFSKN